MTDYKWRKAIYKGIPCYYNPFTDEIIGRNWFYDKLVSIALWVDINIIGVEEFSLYVEVDELEK